MILFTNPSCFNCSCYEIQSIVSREKGKWTSQFVSTFLLGLLHGTRLTLLCIVSFTAWLWWHTSHHMAHSCPCSLEGTCLASCHLSPSLLSYAFCPIYSELILVTPKLCAPKMWLLAICQYLNLISIRVKDLVLWWEDTAQILHCCGCGVAWQV